MNDNRFKKIIYINEMSFFVGWVIILLLGADKPPPLGFIWLVLLVTFLDVCQYFYLKKFLPRLKQKTKGLFRKNLLYFLLGGTVVSLLTIVTRLDVFFSIGFFNVLIWVAVMIIVGVMYGVYFYLFNRMLIKFIKQV